MTLLSAGRGVSLVEELIVNIVFLRSGEGIVARISSEAGGHREYRAGTAVNVIDQVIEDLREEVESLPPK